jgi:two-component system, OmpR family, response regulator
MPNSHGCSTTPSTERGRSASSAGIGWEQAEPDHSILLVEDDVAMAEVLVETLRHYGFEAEFRSDWTGALGLLHARSFDLILLDQRLGRVDTIARLPELRALTSAPIIFLSGNTLEADRIVGLEMGADDFLVKPVSGREIVARVRALLRRAGTVPHAAPRPSPAWRIAETERRLYAPDGSVVPLTAAEFSLLEVLARNPGQPADRERLTESVLHRSYRVEDRSIDNLVYQLRQKIAQAGGGEVIVAMRSRGYAFTGFGAGR